MTKACWVGDLWFKAGVGFLNCSPVVGGVPLVAVAGHNRELTVPEGVECCSSGDWWPSIGIWQWNRVEGFGGGIVCW